jgi:hypothetical protein
MDVTSAIEAQPKRYKKASRALRRSGGPDHRTWVALRAKALAKVYADALGGAASLTALQIEQVSRASQLAATAELMRNRALNGTVEIGELVKLENIVTRLKRSLGITEESPRPRQPRGRAPKPSRTKRPPSLAEVLGAGK